MRTGRNQPCTCGSGKKFKNCCAGRTSRASSKGLVLLVVAIAVIAAIGVYGFVGTTKEAPVPLAPVQAGQPAVQPPGPAPAGKVWSLEHGHWHDAPTQTTIPIPPSAPAPGAALTPAPQPPGPVPAGKVWSTEHGHWHDAPKE